jgi:hypothetical protein
MKIKAIYSLTIISILLILVIIFIIIKPSQKVLSPISKIQPTSSPTPTITPTPTLTPTPTVSVPTSTPVPTPTPMPLTSAQLEDFFTKYANLYSVDKELLKKIAYCESKYNTNAKFNDYLGLFQFSTNTWVNNRNLMGQDNNPDLRTKPDESIKTAAFVISRNGQNAWPSCIK